MQIRNAQVPYQYQNQVQQVMPSGPTTGGPPSANLASKQVGPSLMAQLQAGTANKVTGAP